MRKSLVYHSFLQGIGSVLMITPAHSAEVPSIFEEMNEKDNMEGYWSNVGHYLYNAMDQVAAEKDSAQYKLPLQG